MTTTMFKRAAMALALAMVGSVTLPFAAQAQAQEGSWLVRMRAIHLDSANTDNTDLGANLTINNR